MLAIGGLPGDAELGCGGTLLQHRARGEDIVLVPLSLGRDGTGGDAMRVAADRLGARVIVTESAVGRADDSSEHQLLLERLVREIQPHTVFVPSLGDDEPDRREAHRLSRDAVTDVPTVLAYETATTTPQFQPSRFVDVHEQMIEKLQALSAYAVGPRARPELRPAYAQAHARYWGRFAGFGEVEPFEVLRQDGKDAS